MRYIFSLNTFTIGGCSAAQNGRTGRVWTQLFWFGLGSTHAGWSELTNAWGAICQAVVDENVYLCIQFADKEMKYR